MKWEKKGLIFVTTGETEWNHSHAQLPIVDTNHQGFWRIYYATRNKIGKSNINFIEVQEGNPKKILHINKEPILSFGKLGSFDESGLMPVAILNANDKKYLYYTGWSLKKTVPYHNSIGLAISNDGGVTFKKYSEGPIFDTRPFEPYSTGTINIIIENGIWKAWYQSVTKWELINGRVEPFYHLKYAESVDGINWNRNAIIAIDLINDLEAGICSASVLVEDKIYKMWYALRKNGDYRNDKNFSYRIGYAESYNGMNWIRKDASAGIDISVEGWDSEMITYPNVVLFKEKKIMFYNGNGFGLSGFGYATSD